MQCPELSYIETNIIVKRTRDLYLFLVIEF